MPEQAVAGAIICAGTYFSLIPRPFKRRRKGPGTHFTRMRRGPPEKCGVIGNWILLYTLRLLSIELHVVQNPRPVAMEIPAHVRTVCTRPFLLLLLLLKGPGYEARTHLSCFVASNIFVIVKCMHTSRNPLSNSRIHPRLTGTLSPNFGIAYIVLMLS